MKDNLQFLAKVLLISAVISAIIKYAQPLQSVPATASISLIIVLSPTLLVGSWLAWQQFQR